MKDFQQIEPDVARALLEFFPPSVCESVLSMADFRSQLYIKSESIISFRNSSVSVKRSELFVLIRNILSGRIETNLIVDESGNQWHLVSILELGITRIKMVGDSDSFYLPNFYALSPTSALRLSGLEEDAATSLIIDESLDKWREILTIRPLNDNEFDDFFIEMTETSAHTADRIRSEIQTGKSEIQSLVPDSELYYRRLAGMYVESTDIGQYAENELAIYLTKLCERSPLQGFLQSILLASHPFVSMAIESLEFELDVLTKSMRWLQAHGDLFSKIGAIEFGLASIEKHPELCPCIRDLIVQICEKKSEERGSRFETTSAIVTFVIGELSRSKITNGMHVYWRRLCAFAHASLIERCVLHSNVNVTEFSQQLLRNRGRNFYLQTLCDLRTDPRWHPDFITPGQIRAEILGRLTLAIDRNKQKILESELNDLASSENMERLKSLADFPLQFFPGPLEGNMPATLPLPQELADVIERELSGEGLDARSFVTVINSALLFKLDPPQTQLVINALRTIKYQLKQEDEKDQWAFIMIGLAKLAAITRSTDLANELTFLMRTCNRLSRNSVSPRDAVLIGINAAAAYSDLHGWCKFLGDWFLEVSFFQMDFADAAEIESQLSDLCNIVPDLWITCGKAKATLEALSEMSNK